MPSNILYTKTTRKYCGSGKRGKIFFAARCGPSARLSRAGLAERGEVGDDMDIGRNGELGVKAEYSHGENAACIEPTLLRAFDNRGRDKEYYTSQLFFAADRR